MILATYQNLTFFLVQLDKRRRYSSKTKSTINYTNIRAHNKNTKHKKLRKKQYGHRFWYKQ